MSLLVINKDQLNAHAVRLKFSSDQGEKFFSGPVSFVTFGSEQYRWHPSETGGNADPDGPAARSTISARGDTIYTLPKESITVIRGQLAGR
jgi:hypothetical protein